MMMGNMPLLLKVTQRTFIGSIVILAFEQLNSHVLEVNNKCICSLFKSQSWDSSMYCMSHRHLFLDCAEFLELPPCTHELGVEFLKWRRTLGQRSLSSLRNLSCRLMRFILMQPGGLEITANCFSVTYLQSLVTLCVKVYVQWAWPPHPDSSPEFWQLVNQQITSLASSSSHQRTVVIPV